MDKSNAGQRVLGARKTLRGADDSLENMLAQGIPDGAQCWVTEEQANYRLVKESQLAPDARFVVKPVGPDAGLWVRESGLVGLALLSGGQVLHANEGYQLIGNYKDPALVQFAMNGAGTVVYTGTVKRLAIVNGSVSEGSCELAIDGQVLEGGIYVLSPGAQITLKGIVAHASGSLQVLLA